MATPQVKRATLFDPKADKKVVVDVGSKQARDLFGKGFQLYTGGQTQIQPQGEGARPSPFSGHEQPVQTQPQAQPFNMTQEIMKLLRDAQQGSLDQDNTDIYQKRENLNAERFGARTQLSADEISNLTPRAQEALMGLRASGIEQQLGGLSALEQSRRDRQLKTADFIEKQQKFYQDQTDKEQARNEKEIDFQRQLALSGYQKVAGPSQLKGYNEKDIVRLGSDIYIKPSDDAVLSVSEAKELGVPYGTTKSQAAKKGITPRKAGTGGGTSGTGIPGKLSPRAQAVYNNPGLLNNYTPTEKGKIVTELTNSGLDMSRFGLEKLTVGQREQIDNYDTILNEARGALGLIESGIDVGPVASTVKSGQALFGGAPEFTKYRSMLNNLGSILLKARSGAAVTPQEYERIRGFIPLVNDDEKTAKVKIDRFMDEITRAEENYIKRATQSSFQATQKPQKKEDDIRKKYNY